MRPDIPVYLSADALRILRRSDAFIKPGANIHNAQFLNHRRAKIVERTPFVVTPFAMDHSAFGALAFVVEADGKRLFYSGDFRGHGRKAALFEELCSKPPRAIDRLLIEGTTLGSASHEERTEEKLEEDLKALYSRYSGLKLVSVSGQNVDRMVTLYKSCKDSGRTFVLDGDNVRHGLCKDLGFSSTDRVENIRRVGEIAKLFMEAGIIVLTAFISPFRADRERVRGMAGHGDFLEIYCDTPIEVCEARDTKGLYEKARAGQIAEFTGISSPYEIPENPELAVNTGTDELDACVRRVVDEMGRRGILSNG